MIRGDLKQQLPVDLINLLPLEEHLDDNLDHLDVAVEDGGLRTSSTHQVFLGDILPHLQQHSDSINSNVRQETQQERSSTQFISLVK